MTQINIDNENGMHISVGGAPVDFFVDGAWVRNGLDEIENYVENVAKPDIDKEVQEKYQGILKDIDAKTQEFDENAFRQIVSFNESADNKIEDGKTELAEYAIEQADIARKYANGTIEEYPEGSAEYWALQAKINYEESKSQVDGINGEVI